MILALPLGSLALRRNSCFPSELSSREAQVSPSHLHPKPVFIGYIPHALLRWLFLKYTRSFVDLRPLRIGDEVRLFDFHREVGPCDSILSAAPLSKLSASKSLSLAQSMLSPSPRKK